MTIKETARAAEFFLSDGVIITGAATGDQADPCELTGTGALCSAGSFCNVKTVWSITALKRNAELNKSVCFCTDFVMKDRSFN